MAPGGWDPVCKIATSSFTLKRPDLALDMALNDSVFVPGDDMIVSLSASNPGDDIDVDLYVYVTVPDGVSFYLPSFTTEPTPFVLRLPAGFSYAGYEILRITMIEGLPDGRYTWSAFFNEHGPSERISEIASADFEIFNVKLTMSVNKTDFVPGDEIRATVGVQNFGPDIYVELYSWVVTPGGAVFFLPRLVGTVSPAYEFDPLPRGAKYDGIPILETTLPAGLPTGAYCIQAALVVQGNQSPSGKIAEAWFTFSDE
jgi:hypothetical protein